MYSSYGAQELKSSYQRHMLVGMLFAAVVLVVPGWLFSRMGPQTDSVSVNHENYRYVPPPGWNSTEGKPRRLYAQEHPFHGQMNVRVTVVPDHPAVTVLRPKPAPVEIRPVIADAVPSLGQMVSNSPDSGIFSDPFGTGIDDGAAGIPKEFYTDRDTIGVVVKKDPEYPIVATQSRKEGAVSVLVYVDERGVLTPFPSEIVRDKRVKPLQYVLEGQKQTLEYCVISEEPKDWFFAKNLIKVLPDWRFAPKTAMGAPVGDFLVISYKYCLGINCSSLELYSKR
jgi:hypothetical protein